MRFLLLGTAFCACVLSLNSSAMGQGGPVAVDATSGGASAVGYVVMAPTTAPLTTTLPGRVVASSTAEVRPQVGGIVTSVNIEEGQSVKAGDLMFTVDDANSRAQVAVAESTLSSAEAQLPSAQSKVTRYESLIGTGGVSRTDFDAAEVALAQAKATVASAKAQLEIAQITLSQASIKAPISGIAGAVKAQIGSLVTAGQSEALTTIRMTDPVYVTLVESYANILAMRPKADAAAAGDEPLAPKVSLTLDNGTLFDQTGSISSADMVVSETTGTVTLRATVPNPQFVLLPGMFVRAHVEIGEQVGVFLVPQRSVTFNSGGEPTAFFVTKENRVEKRVLTATQDMNNAWVVTAGVVAGDKLVVDGLQKISDGSAVEPVEVTISDNGVVYQKLDATAGTTAPEAGVDGTKP